MVGRQVFESAKRAISLAHERESTLVEPFLSVFPVTGAAVSVLVGGAGQWTISSSDATASRLDELQFDLGEGPCWEAMATHLPVLRNDFASPTDRWPLFTRAVRDSELFPRVGAIFAFPLHVGNLDIGAIDLYSTTPREIAQEEISDVSQLARLASWQVLRRIISDEISQEDQSVDGTPYSRREIHQATGMVLAQLDITADDALLLLRAHAFSSGRSVREIANDVVERRLDFTNDGSR